MRIVMYSKDDCELCERARQYFSAHPHIAVSEHKLATQAERDACYDRLGARQRLMPQLLLVDADGAETYLGNWLEVENCNLGALFA